MSSLFLGNRYVNAGEGPLPGFKRLGQTPLLEILRFGPEHAGQNIIRRRCISQASMNVFVRNMRIAFKDLLVAPSCSEKVHNEFNRYPSIANDRFAGQDSWVDDNTVMPVHRKPLSPLLCWPSDRSWPCIVTSKQNWLEIPTRLLGYDGTKCSGTSERNGGYYIAGTRISLDSIVLAFEDGESPETILESFPVAGPEKVETYLRAQEKLWGDLNTKETPLPESLSAKLRSAKEHA
jgi:uncharacterized protein (DUF433 family)